MNQNYFYSIPLQNIYSTSYLSCYLALFDTSVLIMQPVIPRSEIAETKPPYVCSEYFIHTYSNNMINICPVQ
jgi:hypothetical protein